MLEKCDAMDGIRDGVLDDPRDCTFDPSEDLSHLMCPGDRNGDACFTRLQIQHVQDFHAGAYDSSGRSVYPGHPFGSEAQWLGLYVPHRGNSYVAGALGVTADHLSYLFYETDPGCHPPRSRTCHARPAARARSLMGLVGVRHRRRHARKG